MIKILIQSLLALGLVTQSAYSQTLDKAKLDSFFNVLEMNNKFMGSVALSKEGKVIYSRQVGFADIENKIKPNINTKYRIGSISKTFTAVLIFKAVEEKKLSLNDKIEKYFPSIKNAGKISIANLLNHHSGINNFTALPDFSKWNTEKKSKEELIEIIAKAGSAFEPGTKAEYSNSNFVLLGYILENIYKKEYAQLLNEKIIKPLNLKNTYYGKKIDLKDNECFSYSFSGGWKKALETEMSIPGGAGAIVSTPIDLKQFADALFKGELISAEHVETMKTLSDNFGMGLFRVPFANKFGYGHNGGIDGFTSALYHFEDNFISVALTSNGTNFNNNDILIALLSAAYSKPWEVPSFKIYQVEGESLNQYLGVYSSKQIPLKITITKNDKTLIAQATGQSSFPLEATDLDKFKYDAAGVVLEFNPEEKGMVLKQGGGTFTFTKD